MSAIQDVFARCRSERRAAFIPYLTAGDPDLGTTGELLRALVTAGADLIELGVPFSDPIADGPVNQRAAARALASGTTLARILDLVASVRVPLGVPIVLFTYTNPLHARGYESFADQASSSGVDGVLCVDLPPEEAYETAIPALTAHGIDPVFLLAPTSTRKRIRLVDEASRGFVYYVSRTGVTGERSEVPLELIRDVKRLRRRLSNPVAVGFGLSTPEQVSQVAKVADGVVVGSALVRVVEDLAGSVTLPGELERRARQLREAIG